MLSNDGDISRTLGGKKHFFSIAFAAIFLLVVVGFGAKSLEGISQERAQESQLAAVRSGSTRAHINANQVIVTEAPELIFVSQRSLLAISPPVTITPQILGAIIGGDDLYVTQKKEVVEYIVEQGDTLDTLAEKFGVSLNTILWANDLKSSSLLAPGQELAILPVSGTLHLVRPADTVSEIAMWYKADIDEIVDFNGFASAQDIFVGDLVIVPDGIMPRSLPSGRLTRIPNSYFIYPVPRSHRLTQGLHYFNAVDLANGKCGEPIYAAAGGTVQRTLYSQLGGNTVRVLHPNKVVTAYGHLSRFAVNSGQRVLQGQIIGYTGHSGYTIPAGAGGCHLHFDVRGATNPFAK